MNMNLNLNEKKIKINSNNIDISPQWDLTNLWNIPKYQLVIWFNLKYLCECRHCFKVILFYLELEKYFCIFSFCHSWRLWNYEKDDYTDKNETRNYTYYKMKGSTWWLFQLLLFAGNTYKIFKKESNLSISNLILYSKISINNLSWKNMCGGNIFNWDWLLYQRWSLRSFMRRYSYILLAIGIENRNILLLLSEFFDCDMNK